MGIQRNAFRIEDLKAFHYLEFQLLADPNLWGADNVTRHGETKMIRAADEMLKSAEAAFKKRKYEIVAAISFAVNISIQAM